MAGSRSYEDPCGVARALDRVGERWALLVVRELLLGPKRFADLKEGLPGASPNVLSQRLDELEEAGVVARRELEPPARAWVYELTPRGRELEGVLLALARWGSQAVPIPRRDLSPDALLLALRTTFDATKARGLPLAIELRIGRMRYLARLEESGVTITRGAAALANANGNGNGDEPSASITVDAAVLRRLVFGDLSLADARERGIVEISGSVRTAARFVGSFRRPTRA